MIVQEIKTSNCTPQTIVIGRRGTYNTQEVVFDIGYLIDAYGVGTAVLAVKRSQDSSAYPAVVAQEDSTVTWTVSETDTYYKGAGECELMWYVDGGLAKTIIYPMVVMRDILSTAEEAPDAYQTWVDDLTALGAETLQNAQDAAQSATDAEAAQTAAETAADRADDALEEFTTPTASATSLAPEAQATAAYSEGHFTFGIPRGAHGATGATPDLEIGTVETLEPDQPATATITGTPENPVLNLGIPKGEKGEGGGGAVESVNGKTGVVVLTASDVGAGTYSKPSGGIPKTDLAAAVQTSLGKADTALQTAPVTSVAGKTGAVTLDAGDAAFSDSETYAAGTVGAAITSQKNAINQKQTAPSSAGTAGQVLGLDSNLDPVWVNQSGGGDTSNCAPIIINTASGDVASFADGADNRQIRKIVGTIVPQQSGTGDPSPTNIRPISGWTVANIMCGGVNILPQIENGYYPLFLPKGTKITASCDYITTNPRRVTYYRKDKTQIDYWGLDQYALNNTRSYHAITLNEDTYYFAFSNTVANVKIEFGSTPTPYSLPQFSTLPINWQTETGTIYGGTVTLNEDGSCDVVKNNWILREMSMFSYISPPSEQSGIYAHAFNLRNWTTTWDKVGGEKNMLCEVAAVGKLASNYHIWGAFSASDMYFYDDTISTVDEFKSKYAGHYILYGGKGAGVSYHFDNIGELYTYLGTNNVWIDTGSIAECDYPADTKLYVDGLTAPDEDMIANANIANGKYFVVNNQLYLSTAAIAAGASIVPGTNCTATNLAEALNALNT